MAKAVKVKKFIPGNVKISTNKNDNTALNVGEDDEVICQTIAQDLLSNLLT